MSSEAASLELRPSKVEIFQSVVFRRALTGTLEPNPEFTLSFARKSSNDLLFQFLLMSSSHNQHHCWPAIRRHRRQRSERESRRKDMAIRRAQFDRLLLEEGKSAEIKEAERVQGLWDEAEQHAARKAGDFSLAWKQVPSVSESHIFGFPERNRGTRVRGEEGVNPAGTWECPRAHLSARHISSLR